MTDTDLCPICGLPDHACRCVPLDEEYDPTDLGQEDPDDEVK